MKRLFIAIPICSLWLACSSAIAQESAKVQVNIKISAKTPSFKDRRLVVMLSHTFPDQEDREDISVDRHIDAKFSHQQGTETALTLTLGAKAKLNRGVQYTLNVTVFEGSSRITHIGEIKSKQAPFNVLNGAPKQLTMVLRPLPAR